MVAVGDKVVSLIDIETTSGIVVKKGTMGIVEETDILGGNLVVWSEGRSCHNRVEWWVDSKDVKVVEDDLIGSKKITKPKELLKDLVFVRFRDEERGVVFGDRILTGYEYLPLHELDGNLLSDNEDCCIDSIYKILNFNGCTDITEILTLGKDNLELIWKRNKEIDYNKLPRDTKVQVSDDKSGWVNRYFKSYDCESSHPYHADINRDDSFIGIITEGTQWKYCRIHESVEIKDEWYK